MLIVLEGVDCTGKSTLAQQLAAMTGAEVQHFGPPERHPLLEWGSVATNYAPSSGDLVLDRFHWGEIVYGPHYRGKSDLGLEGFMWLELVLASRGAVTVLTTGDPDKIYARVVSSNDAYVDHDIDHLRGLADTYEMLARRAHTPIVRHAFDYGMEIDLEALIALARRQERQLATAWPEYIGSGSPEVLLVGECPGNPEDDRLHHLPFPPWPGSSGHYLFRTLTHAEVASHSFGIVNAENAGGIPIDLDGLWDGLGRPNVIALGNVAATHLADAAVPFSRVPHPQWVRRFHHTELLTYAAAIDAAATRYGVDGRRFFT